MARKSSKIAFSIPAVGEVWICRNGEQREVVSIKGSFIEWKRASGVGYNSGNSGICDVRAWHTGSNPALKIVSD